MLVCGCGNKLKCTYEEVYDDIKISNSVVFDFKNNTYKSKDIMIFKSNEEATSYFKDVEDYVEEYNLILEQNKIISELEEKLTTNASKKEIKKQYESYDYKCK